MAEAPIAELLADARVGSAVGHQCRYGQRAQTAGGGWLPVRKATRCMSSAPEALGRPGHLCQGGHRHAALVGGRAAAAAVYPPPVA